MRRNTHHNGPSDRADYNAQQVGTQPAMNETIAKLTPHLPLDDISLADAVSTAKAVKHKLEERLPIDELRVAEAVSTAKHVKHNIEQRYKTPPRKSKARVVIPLLIAFVVGAAIAAKMFRDRSASQPVPSAPPAPADEARRAAGYA